MVRVTVDLLKRKSEHNDEGLANLEEIALHQLQIEKIEVIGKTSKKLKILLLQDNAISKIEGLNLCKDLEYLNLGLNNIQKIEGLNNCEFLKKLDLLLCFIEVEHLEESINNLKDNERLSELQLLGNPCMDWENCKMYVLAHLTNLKTFNNKSITVAEKIQSKRQKEKLTIELKTFILNKPTKNNLATDLENMDSNLTNHTPQTRTMMCREKSENTNSVLATGKFKGKEENKTRNKLYLEDYYDNGKVRQCNQCQLEFKIFDTDTDVTIVLFLPKYLSSEYITVDTKSDFVKVIVKGKIFRLAILEKIETDRAKCQRSLTTGELKLVLPKSAATKIKFLQKTQPAKNAVKNTHIRYRPKRQCKLDTLMKESNIQ